MAERLRTVAATVDAFLRAPDEEGLVRALGAVGREALPTAALALSRYDVDTDTLWEPGSAPRPLAETPWAPALRNGRTGALHASDGSGVLAAPLLDGDTPLGLLVATPDAAPLDADDEAVVELLASLTVATLARMAPPEIDGHAVSESRFRAMFEQFPLSVQIFDPEGWSLDVNRAWQELFRLPPEAMEHFNPLRDSQLEAVRDLLLRGFAGETVTIPPHVFDPAPLDGEVPHPRSRPRWLEVTVCPVRDAEGVVREAIVLHHDVTEQQETAEALSEREHLLAEAQRLAGLGSWTWEVDRDRVTWSDELYRIYGLEPGAFGASFAAYLDRVHPEDRAHVRENIERAVATGEPFAFEERVVRPDGTVRALRSVGEVTRDSDGRAVRLLGVCLDVTERKEAEAALRRAHDELEQRVVDRTAELAQAETRFRAIVEASPTPLLLSRADDGTILYANDRLEALVGVEPGSLAGSKTPNFYYDLDDRPQVVRAIQEQGYVRDLELRIRRSDGTPRWVSLSAQRLVFDGAPTLATALVDITERKGVEEALRQRTEELEAIFRALPDLYFRMEADGTILAYRAGRSFGLYVPPDAFMGQRVQDVLPPPVGGQVAEALAEVARTGDVVRIEYELPLGDEPRFFEARLLPLADRQVITVVRDVTEQKRAEEAILASEASYRGLFDTLTELVYIQDLEGRFLNVNEAVVRAYGYTREELVGQTPEILGAPGTVDPEAFAATFAAAVAGAPQRFEWWGRRKDGSVFPKEVVIQRSTYFGQDVVIAVARDVTAQKEAEAALQQSEEHFRSLIENGTDLIQLLDATGRTTYVSPSAERLVGFRPEEMIGAPAEAGLHPDDVESALAALARAVAHPGRTQHAEYRVRHRDGSWRLFEGFGRTFSPTSAEEGVVINAREITERKEAEEALRRSAARFRSLIEDAHDITCIIDLSGVMTYMSPSIRRILGWEIEEVEGQSAFAFIHPDDTAEVAETVGAIAAAPGTTGTAEYRFRHKDGSWRLMEGFGRTLSPHSTDEGIVVNVRDITERKEAEAELIRQRAYFEDILDSIDAGIAVFDAAGRLEYVSPKAMVDPEMRRWVIGKTVGEYGKKWGLSAEVIEPRQRSLDEARATRQPYEFEQTLRTPDGRDRIMLRRILPVLDESGEVMRMIGYSVDITERKRAEETLRFQKTLLEAEGEASIDGILVISNEGHILSYNRRFVEMWGIPPEVVASGSDEAAMASVFDQLADPQAFRDRVAYLYAHPDEEARDEIALRDGRVFDRYSAPVRSGQGEHYGRIWFFRDMTTQKRHAEELEQARHEAERARGRADVYAQSLERSLVELRAAQEHLVQQEKLASLGRLTAGVAHELKNPLNFVVNFSLMNAELVDDVRTALAEGDEGLAQELLADVETNARKANEHGRRASAIVQDMMEHEREGRSGRAEQRAPVDVDALVEAQVARALEEWEREHPTLPVRVVREAGAAVGAVEAVREDLSRIVHILLANAFEALLERAEADPAFDPTVTVATRREEGTVTISVADNGVGVDEASRDRLFEPLFTTKPAGSGHPGLGLSLAHEAVVGHGGWIDVEARPGGGAVFSVILPTI